MKFNNYSRSHTSLSLPNNNINLKSSSAAPRGSSRGTSKLWALSALGLLAASALMMGRAANTDQIDYNKYDLDA